MQVATQPVSDLTMGGLYQKISLLSCGCSKGGYGTWIFKVTECQSSGVARTVKSGWLRARMHAAYRASNVESARIRPNPRTISASAEVDAWFACNSPCIAFMALSP